jgi:hypothetical protein
MIDAGMPCSAYRARFADRRVRLAELFPDPPPSSTTPPLPWPQRGLVKIARTSKDRVRLRRAGIVLASVQGRTTAQIAEMFAASEGYVGRPALSESQTECLTELLHAT